MTAEGLLLAGTVAEGAGTGHGRPAILLVDDNASKRMALKAALLPLGFPIVEADSGRAALRCVMAQDFAVILLDVRMPIMDGFETAALIRQRRQSELTPIIFITAYASDEIGARDRYVEGAVDFIFAPVAPDELRAKISVFANLFTRAESLAADARQVQTSADQLRLLTEAAPIGIFQTGADNTYAYTNPRWTEITGIPAADALGRPWDILLTDEHRLRLGAESAECGGAAERSHRFRLERPGSSDVVALLTSVQIPSPDGGVAGWVGTLADVTAEAGAEAAMAEARDRATEASRLKSDFLANVSHEIRTPMNGVIGMTDLLLETELDDRQRDYAQTVRNSSEALLAIINDILDFSTVEAGKLVIDDVEFDVRTVVDEVVGVHATTARTKGLAVRAIVDPGVPAAVCGDPGRVRQVLANLVGNAVKFTRSGEIAIAVGMAPGVGDSGKVIRVVVSDTGDGIAEDKIGAIFQPFVQADSSNSRRYGGAGLGLAISGQLVALMGGECGVSSRLGEGSEFWFTVAAGSDCTGPPAPDEPAGESQPAGVPASRLLLAEDNLINQKVAVAMLSLAGYQVDTVSDGAAAVKAFATGAYDAVLMDCQMPELNGYEATAAIRAHEGTKRHTPIIAMTAGARPEDQARCLAEGMDSYLAKPVSKDALLAVVARAVGRANSPPTAALPSR